MKPLKISSSKPVQRDIQVARDKRKKKLLQSWALTRDYLNSAKLLGISHGIPMLDTKDYLEYMEANEFELAWDTLYELAKKNNVQNVSFWENLALASRNMMGDVEA